LNALKNVNLQAMEFSSALLETAVNEFAKLPGIGKKNSP
jgi:Holliday junction resolvasome RuvABC DNA-binding subunit